MLTVCLATINNNKNSGMLIFFHFKWKKKQASLCYMHCAFSYTFPNPIFFFFILVFLKNIKSDAIFLETAHVQKVKIAMVRWRDKDGAMTRYSIALSSHLTSPSLHRTVASSHNRHRTVIPSCHRHSALVIAFRHRSIDPELDGAIVNFVAWSGFHIVRANKVNVNQT